MEAMKLYENYPFRRGMSLGARTQRNHHLRETYCRSPLTCALQYPGSPRGAEKAREAGTFGRSHSHRAPKLNSIHRSLPSNPFFKSGVEAHDKIHFCGGRPSLRTLCSIFAPRRLSIIHRGFPETETKTVEFKAALLEHYLELR